MSSPRYKTAFALECSIRELCRKNPLAISGSATFSENLTDIAEAHRRWRNLLGRIRRRIPKVALCGVWERQKRGAWHVHYVASHFIDVNWLRQAAIECGFGPQMKLQPVNLMNGFKSGSGVNSAVAYCCKYLKKDLEYGEGNDRLVFYHGGSRSASTRFRWAHGMAKMWRLGRDIYSEVYGPCSRRQLHKATGFIMRLGFEMLSEDERWALLETSDVVRRWWYGSTYEQHFPF